MTFRDRVDAGRKLAALLVALGEDVDVVLGLPRGGVPVAAEVARALERPLDVVLVRKLGLPSQPELAMGAIGEDGARVVNETVVEAANVTAETFGRVEARERVELDRRAARYRRDRPRVDVRGRKVLIVDDGLATGSTARVAVEVARHHGASRVVVAVPVAPPETLDRLRSVADDAVAVETPEQLWAIGAHYEDFAQTSDDEVVALLDRAAR